MPANETLTDVGGLRVGHAHTPGALSGCTVILPEVPAPAAVDIRGGAPGTYGTDSLNPVNLVDRIHALFITGGSAFGLAVADGIRMYLRERSVGFSTEYGRIPIVSGAVIFDLGISGGIHPQAGEGRNACLNASAEPVEEGCVGAGRGATVGKLYGLSQATKGGLGSFAVRTPGGLRVGALVVVNPFGDVVDFREHRILAGCRRTPDSMDFTDTQQAIFRARRLRGFSSGENTVVAVVATNASMTKTELAVVARMAHDGLARTVVPCHTQYDGDVVFALSCGEHPAVESSIVGTLAGYVLEEAVRRAVLKACPCGGLPAARDLLHTPSDVHSSSPLARSSRSI